MYLRVMQIKVKAGSIQNLTDARYFSSKEVAWLGFDFNPDHERYIEPRIAQQIMEWLQGPKMVAQLSGSNISKQLEAAMVLNIPTVQSHVNDWHTQMDKFDGQFIPIVDLETLQSNGLVSLKPFGNKVEAVLLQLEEGAEVLATARPLIKELVDTHSVILSAGSGVEELELAEQLGIEAIEVSGGLEEQIGVRSFEELDVLFDRLWDEF